MKTRNEEQGLKRKKRKGKEKKENVRDNTKEGINVKKSRGKNLNMYQKIQFVDPYLLIPDSEEDDGE